MPPLDEATANTDSADSAAPAATAVPDAPAVAAAPQGWRRWTTECLLALTLFVAGAAVHPIVEYDNTKARYFLLSSVVDYGTLDIDHYSEETIDLSKNGDHYYSNKAIGAPLLAWPVYAAMRALPPWRGAPPLSLGERWAVKVWASSLPTALLAVLLFRLALALGAARGDAAFMTIAYGLGTVAWQHATQFSGHQLGAALGFAAFAILWRLTAPPPPDAADPDAAATPPAPAWRAVAWAAVAGLAVGGAVLADYLTGIVAVGLTLWALTRRLPWGQFAAYIAGGGALAAILGVYNTLCFGAPWRLSYGMQATELFAEGSRQGFFGVALPSPFAFLALLFSPGRGLFTTMPVLALALIGLWRLWRRGARSETLLIGGVVLAYLLANAGFYGWHAGWAYGPRYLTNVIPFLALPIAFAPVHRVLRLLLFLASAVPMGLAALAVAYPPEFIYNPVLEFMVPMALYGYVDHGLDALAGGRSMLWVLAALLAVIALAIAALHSAQPPATLEADAPEPAAGRVVPLPLQGVLAGWLLVVALMLRVAHTDPEIQYETRIFALTHAELSTGDPRFRRAINAELDARRNYLLP